MSRDLVGVTLGRYRCVEFIGLGGMAEVYRAVDTELDRVVAIKVLHPFLVSEDRFPERFRREARTLAALQHPNIVRVFDSGLQDFNSYVVMEYVPGLTLKDRLRELNTRGERMPVSEVRRIFDALFAALGYAHRANVVHRDLKLTNVILADDGRVVLTDFGLAKIVGSTLHTASMAMIGTPAYMAPEQAQAGTVDPRSDIYSLGVILFELLTGRLPFEADTPFAMIAKHTQEPPPRVSSLRRDLPRGLDPVLLKATAKDPAGRFQSVEQFADALNAAFEGRRIPFIWTRPRLARAARNGLALAVAVVVLGFVSTQGWFNAASPLATPTLTPPPTATRMLRALIIGLTDLFEQPDPLSPVIARLEAGTEVALLDQQGMWLQVRTLNSGLVGWVDSRMVLFLPPDTPPPTLTNTPPAGTSPTPTPTPSATPRPSATATASATPTSGSRATPDAQSPSSTPAAAPSSTPTPIPTGTAATATTAPTQTPTPRPSATPTPLPSATSTPRPPTATSTPAPPATPNETLVRTLPPFPTPTKPSGGG